MPLCNGAIQSVFGDDGLLGSAGPGQAFMQADTRWSGSDQATPPPGTHLRA